MRTCQARYAPDHVAFTRACHVLSLVASPAARDLLTALAAGAPDDRRTMDAKQTLAWLPPVPKRGK